MAGAEDLQQDLGHPGVAGEIAQGRAQRGHRRQEPLEVRQRHPRIGAAGQNGVEHHGQPVRRPPATRPPPAAVRSARSRLPRSGIAHAQPGEPLLAPPRESRDTSETSRQSSESSQTAEVPEGGSPKKRDPVSRC